MGYPTKLSIEFGVGQLNSLLNTLEFVTRHRALTDDEADIYELVDSSIGRYTKNGRRGTSGLSGDCKLTPLQVTAHYISERYRYQSFFQAVGIAGNDLHVYLVKWPPMRDRFMQEVFEMAKDVKIHFKVVGRVRPA